MARKNVRVPPGPSEKYDTAQELLDWLCQHLGRYGDIFKASVYGSTVYVVSAPAYAEHVLLTNWQNYPRKGQAIKRIALTLGNGLMSSNGEFWVSQRRMIQPAFNRNAIGALAGVIRDANVALLARWKLAAERGTEVNVTRDVSHLVLEITLRAIFGDDYAEIVPHFAIIAEESRNLEFAKQCNSMGKVIIQAAVTRRAAGKTANDILGMLMQAKDRDRGQPMPDAQLAREVLTIIIAGHETTSSVLNWTWYLLARHPAAEARISAEIESLLGAELPPVDAFPQFEYTRQVIAEALRLYPPGWLMTRTAVHDDWLGEYFVPAGTEIYISPYLIQRHPALWQAPGQFDPDRFVADGQERHRLAACPFGAGPRNCIGEFLARLEMQIHLMIMVRELRLRYDDSRPADMVAGINLLSGRDFLMAPELRTRAAAAPTDLVPLS
jgi:enediyne biosynthesis protein E7